MIRYLMITAATLGLIAAAAPTLAASEVVVHEHAAAHGIKMMSKSVRYQDLDLSTAQGADTLVSRIRSASKTVCQHGYKGKMSLHERKDYDRCVGEAMQEAVQGVNSPKVSAAYQASN